MKTTLKRIAAPKTWPILRKETTFITRPRPNGLAMEFTLPLAVVLRDMLKIVSTSKQAKQLMREHEVTINGTRVFQPDDSIGLMDVLAIGKEMYFVTISQKGLLHMQKADHKHTIQKLVGKTNVRGGKVQLNFLSGMNLLVDKDTYKTNDSVTVENGKITGHLAFKKGAEVLIIGGTHMGAIGKIENIEGDVCTIKTEKSTFSTTKENVYVTA